MLISSKARLAFALLASAVAISAGAFATEVSASPVSGLLIPVGCMVVLLGAVFSVLHRRKDVFAPLGLVSIFYAATFVGGAVYFWFAKDDPLTPRYDSARLGPALWMAVLAYAVFVGGYAIRTVGRPSGASSSVAPGPRTEVTETGRTARTIKTPSWTTVGVLLVLGWVARVALVGTGRYFHASESVREVGGATGWITIFSDLPVLALAIVAVRWYSRADRSPFGFLILIAVELSWALPTGSRANVLTVGLLLVVARYYLVGRLPRARVLIPTIIIIALVLFPALAKYRTLENATTNPVAALTESVAEIFDADPGDAVRDGLTATFSRFSASTSVAAAIAGGREQLPLPHGQSYLWIPSQVVPRALWPNKPEASTFGVTFGRSYGFSNDDDYNTSFAITQFLEGWFAGGYAGVVIAMFVLGIVYRAVADLAAGRFAASSTLAVYAWLSWRVVNSQESILASANIALVKSAAVALIALWIAGRVGEAGILRQRAASPSRLVQVGPVRSSTPAGGAASHQHLEWP